MNTRPLPTLSGPGGNFRKKAVAFRRNPGQYDTRRTFERPATISRIPGQSNQIDHEHDQQEGAMS